MEIRSWAKKTQSDLYLTRLQKNSVRKRKTFGFVSELFLCVTMQIGHASIGGMMVKLSNFSVNSESPQTGNYYISVWWPLGCADACCTHVHCGRGEDWRSDNSTFWGCLYWMQHPGTSLSFGRDWQPSSCYLWLKMGHGKYSTTLSSWTPSASSFQAFPWWSASVHVDTLVVWLQGSCQQTSVSLLLATFTNVWSYLEPFLICYHS